MCPKTVGQPSEWKSPQSQLSFQRTWMMKDRLWSTCDEAEERLDVSSVLEVGAAEAVPDNVRHLFHQLPAGRRGGPSVLGQVHGPADLSREAFVQRRNHAQLHRGEAGGGTVGLQRLKANPRNVYGDHPVHGQKVLHEPQNQREESQVWFRLTQLGIEQLHHAVDPSQREELLLGGLQSHGIRWHAAQGVRRLHICSTRMWRTKAQAWNTELYSSHLQFLNGRASRLPKGSWSCSNFSFMSSFLRKFLQTIKF